MFKEILMALGIGKIRSFQNDRILFCTTQPFKQPLKETTTGEDIFNEVQRVFKSFGLPYHSISLIWSVLNTCCIHL
ncbi:hypothetical protein Trydic_g2831 [Trypoxylus dichotomus]